MPDPTRVPSPAPLAVKYSQYRLHRTVGGLTRAYDIVESVTLVDGGKPLQHDRDIKPTAWTFTGVHESGIDGSPVHFGFGGSASIR